jgi:adenosylhomocysteine nucleosidase
LFRATGALAVDMETAIVREATARLNVPIIAIRSISDAANETLHPELLSLIDDLGRVKLSAVASLLARRPQMLLSLLRLRGRSNAALRALGKASSSILRDSLASSF